MSEKKFKDVSIFELVLVASTRAAIGVGIGLLLADKLSARRRKVIGIPIFVVGVLSTIPIAMHLFNKEK